MALSMTASPAFGARLAPAPAARPRASAAAAPAASLRQDVARVAKLAGAAAVPLLAAFAAQAADVKLGATGGALVFDPATVTIKAGETVTWTNNVGFPHNVVFDEDAIPAGVSADSLNHEDYLNAPGEKVSSKFTKPGTYEYYCEPHQGAGMAGKIIVQ